MKIKNKKKFLTILFGILVIIIPISIKAVVITHDGGEFGWIVHHNYSTGNASTLTTTYKHLSTGEPAYCLEPKKETPINLNYGDNKEMDDRIYRLLANGYPSKKITGDWKKDYYITQVAVWCLNGDYKTNTLTGSLMTYVNKLLDIAYNGDDTRQSKINFNDTNVNCSLNSDGKYFYSDWISVNCNKTVKQGTVRVSLEGAPAGTQFVDTQERTGPIFAVNEKFRVRIPVNSVTDNLKFKINVTGNIATCYAYRFISPRNDIQDVASFVDRTRTAEVTNSTTVNLTVPVSKLIVLKTDASGNKKLQGAVFEVSDSTGKVVKTITSNGNGQAVAEGLKLGTYSVKETKAPTGYEISDGAKSFQAGLKSEVDITFRDNITHMQVMLRKIDNVTKKPLGNAVFELSKDGKVIGTYTSSSNGIVRLGDLSFGTYQAKEISAPEGYIISSKPFDIIIDENHTRTEIEAPNRIAQANVKLIKTDASNSSKLEGAKFDLCSSDNTKIGSYTTDRNGEINVPSVKYGSYYFVETQSPSGYVLDGSHKNFKVTVADDSKTVTVNSTNNKIKSSVQLVKKDSKDGSLLQNASFNLYTKAGIKLGTYVTNKDGIIRVDNLNYGDYYFSEIKAPVGYNINNSKVNFSVTKDTNGKTINVECKDDFIKANVQLTKTDSESHKPLQGIAFDLFDSNNVRVGSYTTDAQGRIIVNGLRYGNYYFKESKTLDGYLLSNSKIPFEVKTNANVNLNFTNTKAKSSVQLVKTDSVRGTKLQGVSFDLYNASSNSKVGSYKTDNNGIITVNNLEVGKYYFVETATLQGYVLNTDHLDFTVDLNSNGKVITVQATNHKITGGVKLVKEDSTNGKVLNGSKYNLYKNDGTLIGNYELKNGSVTVDNLEYGDYYVVETQSPVGYFIDSNPIHFSVKDNSTIKVVLKDKPVKVTVRLLKKDKETAKPLQGAKFTLYNGLNRVGDFVTDANGLIQVNLNNTPANYTFVETSAPTGYVKDSDNVKFSVGDLRNNKEISVEATNSKIKGGVNLYKSDKETSNKLANAKFDLYKDTTKIGTYTTTADGHLTVGDLEYGSYYFQEVQAPEGYRVNSAKLPFNISTQGQVVNVKCLDEIFKSNVQLVKVDSETNAPIEGTSFDLHKADGTVIGSYKTDSQGKIVVNDLKYGSYYFMETKPSESYVASLDKISFNVSATTDKTTIQLKAQNRKIIGKVKLVKKDSETNQVLSGTKFALFDNRGNKIGEYTTDKDGTINVGNLKYGDYFFKELSPSTGYVLNTNNIPFSIRESGKLVEVTATNNIIKGNVDLLKVDAETNSVIANTVFELFTKSGNKIGTYTTDATGHIRVNNLKFGKYYFKESKPSTGYNLNGNKYEFNISENGKTVGITAKNDIIKGNVKLTKLDNETNAELQGTVFDLFQNNGTKIGTYTTNKDGTIEVDNLKYGEYYFKESKPSEGYLVNNTVYKFNITEQGKTILITATNQIIKGNIKIVKTDEETKHVLTGVEFGLYQGDKEVAKGTTLGDGSLVFNNLKYGHYTVKELKPATGYLNSVKPFDVFVSENGKTYTYNLTNRIIKGKIKIIKYDDSNYAKIRGAKFHVYKAGDLEHPIADLTTGHKGEVLTGDLNYGDYFVKEYDAPKDFYLNNQLFPVSITEDGAVINVHVVDMPVKFKLILKKSDTETGKSLAGAQFQLYRENHLVKMKVNSETIDTFTTDVNGSICLPQELGAGDYKLVEVKAPEGYLIAKPIEFKIDRNTKFSALEDGTKCYNVDVEDQVIKGSVEISKTDINSGKALPNTTITIFSNDKKTKVFEGVTDSNGILKFGPLKYGDYYYQETKAPEGYVIDESLHQFSIKEDGKVVKCNMTDEKIKGSIEISKSDINTGKLLPNTAIRIYAEDGKTVVYSGVTDANGLAKFGPLNYGKYYYQEYKAPEGYLIDSNMYPFEIKTNGEVIKAEMKDTMIKGGLEICKTDIVDGKILPNTIFAIYNSEGKIVQKGKTNEEGIAKFNLNYGKYYYQEIEAPKGYNVSHEKFPFEIKEDGVIVKANMADSRIQGDIEITKVDAVNGKVLPNTTFKITDENGKEIVTGTTDSNGIYKFKLDYGTYYYQEVQAPSGYKIDNGKYKFQIKENGEIVKAKMKDDRIEKVHIPVTGDILRSPILYIGCGIIIIIACIVTIYLKRRK